MSTEFRLFLQVMDRHLRLVPLGNLTAVGVEQILGAAQAGFQAYSVVVVDLEETRITRADLLSALEEGLRRLVAEKRLLLGIEPNKWTMQEAPPETCRCQGNCQNCPCRSQGNGVKIKKVKAA